MQDPVRDPPRSDRATAGKTPAAEGGRAASRRRRWWPDSLFGQMVCVLLGGLLAAQLLTSTIWFDIRQREAMEIPARLVAARTAHAMRVIEAIPRDDTAARDAALAALRQRDLDLELVSRAEGSPYASGLSVPLALRVDTQSLLVRAIEASLGRPVMLQLAEADLQDGYDDEAGLLALFGNEPLVAYLRYDVALAHGGWLRVSAKQEQAWSTRAPVSHFVDYFLRIYVVRMVILAAIALLVVRMLTRPLNRLARAAEALGKDIRRPSLPVRGPLEVRRAASAFNMMQRRLIDTLAERTRFLAAVSHDLRSPITRMRLRMEWLEPGTTRDKLYDDLAQMEALVDATLDYVRTDETQKPVQRIDVDSLVDSLCSDMQDMGHDVVRSGGSRGPLLGYPLSLRRCLQNLVHNAVRYGGRARIEIADDGPELRISVHDDGPGVPTELLQRIREPFFRAESSRNAQTGGHGLGLSIAQAVAEAHGGRLELENRQEGGLRASLILPRVS
ncbi:MAG: ATP-binding protein [Pigmentiphaga sp.]